MMSGTTPEYQLLPPGTAVALVGAVVILLGGIFAFSYLSWALFGFDSYGPTGLVVDTIATVGIFGGSFAWGWYFFPKSTQTPGRPVHGQSEPLRSSQKVGTTLRRRD